MIVIMLDENDMDEIAEAATVCWVFTMINSIVCLQHENTAMLQARYK